MKKTKNSHDSWFLCQGGECLLVVVTLYCLDVLHTNKGENTF
jgi:hypothetical protein